MQRSLTGLQFHIDRLGLVDIDRDLLAASEEVILVERVGVLDLLPVGARDELHAAGNFIGRRNRDPCGGNVG